MDDDESHIPLGDEFPGRRLATKGKRKKPWTIECEFIYSGGLTLLDRGWEVWHRYETEARRDKALLQFKKQGRTYIKYRAGN